MTLDAIDALLGQAAASVRAARDARPVTKQNAQASFTALFSADAAGITLAEKLIVAVFVAQLHGDAGAADFYAELAAKAGVYADVMEATVAQARAATVAGPYGDFDSPRLAAWNQDGPEYAVPAEFAAALGARLSAALEHAHVLVFHLRDARPDRLQTLLDAGFTRGGIVTLSQEVAFLAFQLRVLAGLAVLAGTPRTLAAPSASIVTPASTKPRQPGEIAGIGPQGAAGVPQLFTSAELGWEPWLTPASEAELTEEQREALIDRPRIESPYFRLLADDPGILKHRTLTDKDIFYNADSGLPRGERELAAAATSRFNGCVFCASVHSRFSERLTQREADVERLLAQGVSAPQDERWRAVIDAATDLSRTPVAFTVGTVERLHAAGLHDEEVYDIVHCSAFFNWANRLMLTLGEPTLPLS